MPQRTECNFLAVKAIQSHTYSPIVLLLSLGGPMLKTQIKRLAHRDSNAAKRLAQIEASILALSDDDLLDLADIFAQEPRTVLGETAFAELARRDLTL